MIATNIGKTFLNAYNEKFKTEYSAKEFFVEVYYELFYNHNKYMMTGGWSPLENPKISWDKMRNKQIPYESEAQREERLKNLIEKIESEEADLSIAIGYPSLKFTAKTSGQITNLNLPLKEDEVYLSWIGSGFGIGVQSGKDGLSLLFDNKQILLDLFEGWKLYRKYLNTTPQLRGNQINTWNGQWLAHRYNKNTYDERIPTASFNPFETIKDGGMEINTQSWTKILLGIARNFPDSLETAYVYRLDKTNITIGFIPVELPKIRQPFELYRKYFDTENKHNEVENIFGTAIGFTEACRLGAIGVRALEPKAFKDYFKTGKTPKYNDSDEEKKISFNTYIIWLLAMLNNEQLWEQAQWIALTLSNYSKSDRNLRTKKSQEVSTLLSTIKKELFIDRLITIVNGCIDNETIKELNKIAREINLMPIDNVPYFLTLIRFQYAVISKIS